MIRDRRGQVWRINDLFTVVVVEPAHDARHAQLEHKVLILECSASVDLLNQVTCVYESRGSEFENRSGWVRLL